MSDDPLSRFPFRELGQGVRGRGDLALEPGGRELLAAVEDWLCQRRTGVRDRAMAGRSRTGLRVLFHCPPGAGQTFAATLLGKAVGYRVHRVDLSSVVSKYIGETERNLAALFEQASDRDQILFFDEADALFGRRTGARDAHDRYANLAVSYLLQRMEDFDGLVILAVNGRAGIDAAFQRRFDYVGGFPAPAGS